MGWLFGFSSREEIRKELTKSRDGTTYYRSCWTGNVLWIQYPGEVSDNGKPFIGCVLVQRDRADYKGAPPRFGYKDMDETMGPYQWSCPLSYLDAVPDPQHGSSTSWRDQVRLRQTPNHWFEQGAERARKGESRKITWGTPKKFWKTFIAGYDAELLARNGNRLTHVYVGDAVKQ